MPYHDNGPRAARSTGRNRNTLINNASKVTVPAVSAGTALSLGSQAGSALSTLYARLAALRAQKGFIRGQFKTDRAAARSNAIAGMSSAVGQALETGTVGSSYDLETRSGVLAQRAADIQAALRARLQGLLGLKTERIGAFNEFYGQVYDIQAQRAAEQQQLALEAFLQDLVLRPGDETAPLSASAPSPSASIELTEEQRTAIQARIAHQQL